MAEQIAAPGNFVANPRRRPLRIEYEWEGCFAFDRLQEGHTWHFANCSRWQRIRYAYKSGVAKPAEKTAKTLFCDIAQNYTAECKELISKQAGEITGGTKPCPNWTLLKWLSTRGAGKGPPVRRGLSVLLNSLIRHSSLKPFEILSSFCNEHVTVEIRGIGDHVPCWFYIKGTPFEDLDEYLIAFPELFSSPAISATKDATTKVALIDLLRRLLHVRILHKYEVIGVEVNDHEMLITLHDRVIISEYIKGAICNCIPIPGESPHHDRRPEPEGVHSPEVVVRSPVVAKALSDLSRVWQDSHANTVLISSPPGSGKEVLAKSIPYGNGRLVEQFQVLSMATEDQIGLERRLYGAKRADGSIEDGLIELAANSAMFLDEIHQPETRGRSSSARASLLRTLEAGMYFPQGSNEERKVRNVLFVMATSKTLKELDRYTPKDFWTRMTHAIMIAHPLFHQSSSERSNADIRPVVEDFFRYFWWDLCERQYELVAFMQPDEVPPHLICNYWQQQTMVEVITDPADYMKTQGRKAGVFADVFLECLKDHELEPHEFSIRGIRNMVRRLFALGWSDVGQGETLANDETFRTNIKDIFGEIVNVARLN